MINSVSEIRQMFLDFFHSKGHRIIPSSSLVPNKDSTLLFTNAGMNQFKDIFLGVEKRDYLRATTSQRCVRAGGKHNDLENVGYTSHHHTFFEMLGNFSFGDYFKYEAIHYAWELLTGKKWFNLPKERLWITVYASDDETYKIWTKDIGIPLDKIVVVGDRKGIPYSSDNFWQMSETGPCGPCTEIIYDHGDHIQGRPPGSPERSGDRYIEIWNIVFIQFNRCSDGTMKLLPNPSVDTGMGLERIAAVLQRSNSNYEIDLFRTLIESVAKIIGTSDKDNKSLRVIADHIRSCAFIISDGIVPSNENRGYVLRRIIRHAILHANMIGVKHTFFYKLVDPLIGVMGTVCEDLKRQKIQIEQILRTEEEQFSRTLKKGLNLLLKKLSEVKGNTLDGKIAFFLHDTYGFPVDLTVDVCREYSIKVDQSGFKAEMERQRRRAIGLKKKFINYNNTIHIEHVSEFHGYDSLELNGTVIALFSENKEVDSIHVGQKSIVFLDKTPFYSESGGQIGDKGELKGCGFRFNVVDTQKYGQAIGHLGKLLSGSLKVGENVKAIVDKTHRECICLNHSATHLLHSALREVIGTHVMQKGCLVNNKMLRFDFSYFKAINSTKIREVENLVNSKIRLNLPIKTRLMDLNKAKSEGAIALFNGKYNEYVRVLSMGNFSIELCGGTHALYTGNIGLFHVISKSNIALGIHRIEAVTGQEAISVLHRQSDQLNDIAQLFKDNGYCLVDKVRDMIEHEHMLVKELQQLKKRIAAQESEILSRKAIEINGIKLIVSEQSSIGSKMLRFMVDNIKNRLNSVIVVLATTDRNKISLVIGVSQDITNRIRAVELVNMITRQVGGKGGGHSEIAQAHSINDNTFPTLLSNIKDWVQSKLM